MICETIYKKGDHAWLVFGQDKAKPGNIVDTNQIVVRGGDSVILLDPGGMEVFPPMLSALTEHVPIEHVRHLFMSHQDPDIGSSLPLWRQVCNKDVKIYLPWLWAEFVTHFDSKAKFVALPDEGTSIGLHGGVTLDVIPAHYLHSPGNFSVYDPTAAILWTGDIGAALVPAGSSHGFFVEDFDRHIQYMEAFHKRWMGSPRARDAWVARVSAMNVEMLVPQHGLIFRGEDVKRFLDWLGALEIGAGVAAIGAVPGEAVKAAAKSGKPDKSAKPAAATTPSPGRAKNTRRTF